MQELEPLNDMLVGNPAAWNRWGATFANSLLPFAGQRGELGRLLAPMKREVNQEFLDLIRNRNNWLDPLDASGKLPYKYDFVDGTMVGYPENWWVRANNAYSPIKQYDGLSAEKQFLVDIEYDSRPFFNKSSGGAEFTTTQRSELYSLVGEQGHFRAILKDVIRDSNRLVYTTMEAMYKLCEPSLRLVRKYIPNFGMVDFSPIVVYFGLEFIESLLIEYWPR